jgi:hypothetical protein
VFPQYAFDGADRCYRWVSTFLEPQGVAVREELLAKRLKDLGGAPCYVWKLVTDETIGGK